MTQTSREYAEALFALALESDRVQETSDALRTVQEAMHANPDYMAMLCSPAIPKEARLTSISETFGDSVPDILLAVLRMLCARGNMNCLDRMAEEYGKLYLEQQGILVAKVASAVALNAEEKDRIRTALEKKTGQRIELNCSVDPSLLGGVRVETDGVVIDGSLKAKLQQIKEVMGT
ncbi:MAG: ATP synthase F1 subunit delta [Clostridia bacterium]|nr:ATP synthase F1 subunit delta [Clostridia bacterium]